MAKSGKFVCWHCGQPMRKRQRICGSCKKRHPAAAKATVAAITKSRGAPPPVVRAVKRAKPPRPVCPSCGAKGKRSANMCDRCSAPYSAAHLAAADKAARDYEARIAGSPEWWRRRAAASHDPEEREHMLAEASKAAGFGGRPASPGEHARLLVKASGARTLREAWERTTDKQAQAILRDVMDRGGYR